MVIGELVPILAAHVAALVLLVEVVEQLIVVVEVGVTELAQRVSLELRGIMSALPLVGHVGVNIVLCVHDLFGDEHGLVLEA